ncbi:MAG: hypothetical protein J0I47_02495 [Sphingomonas sp.]|nr:hypothetical protein [Sphingomonas sp.]
MRLPTVIERTGSSAATIYRMTRPGEFSTLAAMVSR